MMINKGRSAIQIHKSSLLITDVGEVQSDSRFDRNGSGLGQGHHIGGEVAGAQNRFSVQRFHRL